MTIEFILAPSWELALPLTPSVTIEAEYGSLVKEGTVFTAAHHQADGDVRFIGRHIGGTAPSPCNNTGIPHLTEGGQVLLSHLDLDSIGGALRTVKEYEYLFNDYPEFWEFAEFLDVNGVHKMSTYKDLTPELEDAIYAYWAWHKGIPRFNNTTVSDISDVVDSAAQVLFHILCNKEHSLIEEGRKLKSEEEKLNKQTFLRMCGSEIILRTTRFGPGEPGFCNHLYTTPKGKIAKAVVTYGIAMDESGNEIASITISLADPDKANFSCKQVLQELLGPEAGGHPGIAGSPRGEDMSLYSLDKVVRMLTVFMVNHHE